MADPDRVEIPLNVRDISLLILLLRVLCISGFAFFFITLIRHFLNLSTGRADTLLKDSYSLLLGIVFVSYVLKRIYIISSSGVGLVIDSRGIVYHNHCINWANITGIVPHASLKGQRSFVIMLDIPEKYTDAKGILGKIDLKLTLIAYGSPIVLTTTFLQCSDTELEKLLNESFGRYKNRFSNFQAAFK